MLSAVLAVISAIGWGMWDWDHTLVHGKRLSTIYLGATTFQRFINGILYFVKQAVIYNYADDNTLSFIHNNLVVLKKVLEEESCILIDCFFFKNFMKANPTKFQAICIGKNAHKNIASFKVDSVEIKCEENVTLLGVNTCIDFMFSFDDHVTDICKKASKQLAVLKRLGRFLTNRANWLPITRSLFQTLTTAR